MAKPPAAALQITDDQRDTLEALVRSRTAAFHGVQRAWALLNAVSSIASCHNTAALEATAKTVRPWRRRLKQEMPYEPHCAQGSDVRVLHCVRDSRAVAPSWTKRVLRPECSAGGGKYMDRYSPALTALKWLQHNGVIGVPRIRGTATRRIRNEGWVRAPAETVRHVLEFGGLDHRPNPMPGNEWGDLATTLTCNGNTMKFTQGRVENRHREEWRESLPAGSRRLIAGLTAPRLTTYVYLKKEK